MSAADDMSFNYVIRFNYVGKTDMVAAMIRELIVTGELRPGQALRQRDLASRFHVSQTPVREALRRLESEGLVAADTHRGFKVAEPDGGRVEENHRIRAALESVGAAMAAGHIDAEGIERLERLNERMRRLAGGDPRYQELNRDFHFALYEYARSPLLLTLMRLVWASRSYDEPVRHHDPIIDALRRRDPDAAAATAQHHVMAGAHVDTG